MRLPKAILLAVIIGTVHATSENAKVYMFPEHKHPLKLSTTTTLTPEEARLVIAHRLGVSQYHSLDDISSNAISHINVFGRNFIQPFNDLEQRPELLANDEESDGFMQLVIIVDGITKLAEQRLAAIFKSTQPDFKISDPPSSKANVQLVKDMSTQKHSRPTDQSCTAFNEAALPPYRRCWGGNTKILHWTANQGSDALYNVIKMTADLVDNVESWDMEVMMILMPESSKNSLSSYGSYDMPVISLHTRNVQVEEPIEPVEASFRRPNIGNPPKPSITQAKVIAATCYPTNDTCITSTNNCSGHGICYSRNLSRSDELCYSCRCVPTVDFLNTGERLTYWGGPTCSKQDISGPFWLLASFAVIMVGVITAVIGMMLSVGEEKLPGVIGAGVSGPKAR